MGTTAVADTFDLGLARFGGKPPDSPEKIKGAAEQFESLLISNMLKSARDAGGSLDGEQQDDSIKELADQQFSIMMARAGGLGLSTLISQGLQPEVGELEPRSPMQGGPGITARRPAA